MQKIKIALFWLALSGCLSWGHAAKVQPGEVVAISSTREHATIAAVPEGYPKDPLLSKLYGCCAMVHIANALGEPVEGKKFGTYPFFDYFPTGRTWGKEVDLKNITKDFWQKVRKRDLTYDHWRHSIERTPAMGEDGCERFRWCASAILRKGERIYLSDLGETIRHEIDPEKYGFLMGCQDQFLLYSLMMGIAPEHVGAFASWPGFIGTTKMLGAAVGMMNAGNPEGAARDARRLALLKDIPSGDGNWAIDVCAAHAAALAEALKSDSTVESVIAVALDQLSETPRRELEENLAFAAKAGGWKDLGPYYGKRYDGRPISVANEILSRALSCFRLADGDPEKTVVYAINLGRDTDCCAYVSGTLAAAFKGIRAVPSRWVDAVEKQIVSCPYANNRRTAWETALGFYRVVRKIPGTPATIDQLVREHLRKPPDPRLTTDDYRRVVSLDGNSRRIASLEGIERLSNLEWLNLGRNRIEDLGPLRGLTRLEFLDLGDNRICDLKPLCNLTGLTTLILDRNRINELGSLRNLVNLRRLNLAENRIVDIAPLASMKNLTSLYLEGNDIRDIRPLAVAAGNLFALNLGDNAIVDIAVLRGLNTIVALYLRNNQITDIAPLGDISSRVKLMDLSDNRIVDPSPLEGLTTLIQLDLGGNQIRDPGAIGRLGNLLYLGLEGNRIATVEPLENLKNLRALYLKGNSIEDFVSVSSLELILKDF